MKNPHGMVPRGQFDTCMGAATCGRPGEADRLDLRGLLEGGGVVARTVDALLGQGDRELGRHRSARSGEGFTPLVSSTLKVRASSMAGWARSASPAASQAWASCR